MNYALKSYSEIWRPYVFINVVATCTDKQGTRFLINVEGECYSEFREGPNLTQLADYVGSISQAQWVGLRSCEYKGFRTPA